ncbi:hypothetical protein [Enterococcus sp. E5-175]|nr:hypothetical protein [Enterococcus sp. E5-175]
MEHIFASGNKKRYRIVEIDTKTSSKQTMIRLLLDVSKKYSSLAVTLG